jgi:hypothetical protein
MPPVVFLDNEKCRNLNLHIIDRIEKRDNMITLIEVFMSIYQELGNPRGWRLVSAAEWQRITHVSVPGCDGVCNFAFAIIYINPAATNVRQTIYHELLHAIFYDDAAWNSESNIDSIAQMLAETSLDSHVHLSYVRLCHKILNCRSLTCSIDELVKQMQKI